MSIYIFHWECLQPLDPEYCWICAYLLTLLVNKIEGNVALQTMSLVRLRLIWHV